MFVNAASPGKTLLVRYRRGEVFMGPSLLRDWEALQDRVIPPLLDIATRPASVWAIGDPADAVAVTVAFADARGACSRIRTFTSGASCPTNRVSVGTADVGCLPTASRDVWFDRERHRWVPKTAIAEHIVLGMPSAPVDLLTVRSESQVDAHALSHLRDGGRMFIIDRPSATGSSCTAPLRGASVATRPSWMRPVGGDGRLFRKVGGIGLLPVVDATSPRGGGPVSGVDDEAPTLAARQQQETLILTYIDLAKALARRFGHRGQPIEDLEQVAAMALASAARRFDPDRGNAFAAYATVNIVGELKRYFRDKTWSVRVPRSLQELHMAVNVAREELSHQLAASPTVAQVASRIGVSEEDVLEAMEAGSSYRADPLDIGGVDDERTRDVPMVDPSFERVLDRHRLSAALPRLDGRERMILKGLYFDGRTQQDVAEDLDISQMQVSRLSARAIAKLQR
jgi:RNA polymerase sigma-B factor